MSKDGFVQVPPNSTGGRVDCASLSVAGATVVRQRVVIGDNASSAGFATVANNRLRVQATFSSSLVVSVGPISKIDAISATVTVAGNVNIASGTIQLSGLLDGISSTVTVAGNVNVSTINNISATVTVAGLVGISSGTVQLSGLLDGISSTVTVAGNVNISTMPAVNISAMPKVTVSGTALVAGAVTLATLPPVAISGTASVVVGGFLDPSGQQRNVVDSANLALRVNVVAGGSGGGTIDKISATVTVAGTVNIGSGTLQMSGLLDGISATVTVAGSVNVSKVDFISSTVTVAGLVGISSGTVQLSGLLDGISATVTVAGNVNISAMPAVNISAMPHVTVDIVSATVNVAVTNQITIANISATVNVVLSSAVAKIALSAGTANIGSINNISATVTVVNSFRGLSTALSTASHGPKTVGLSSSSTVALVVAPGAALSIYVDAVVVTNGAANLGGIQMYEGSNTGTVVVGQYLAANGGGFSVNFDPPWKVSANTQLSARLKPSTSAVLVTVNFHVAA